MVGEKVEEATDQVVVRIHATFLVHFCVHNVESNNFKILCVVEVF